MSDTSQIHRRWDLDDATVEAIIYGRPIAAEHEPLAAFARQVRSAAVDLPGPAPSDELARILRGDDVVTTKGRRSVQSRRGAALGKVAGLGLAAKIALGTGVAAASVASAGAAGVLPSAADHAVRNAIEAVTPVHFHDGSDEPEHPDNFGDRVSRDATGASDGTKGVDGQKIAEEAPGSEHRPDHRANGDGSGQPDSTGLTRANETPAAPHAGPKCEDDDGPAGTPEGACKPDVTTPTTPTVPEQANDHANR
jgi:hypothetical protein